MEVTRENDVSEKTGRAAVSGWTIIADALWLAAFFLIWGMLIALWDTWFVLILVPTFALMLEGLTEFVHQSAHYNLFLRMHSWNKALGTLAGGILGIDHQSYRTFHLKHHRVLNTPEDPERSLYSFPAYVDAVRDWRKLSDRGKARRLVSAIGAMSRGILSVPGMETPLVRILRWAIPVSIALAGFLQGYSWLIPLMVIVAWYLPLILFICFDFFLLQSRHYETELRKTCARVDAAEQYHLTWNLRLPAPVSFMLMRRNLHAEHHEYPGTYWLRASDKDVGRTLRPGEFLRLWWRNGPKHF